jgi:hypothetical protein
MKTFTAGLAAELAKKTGAAPLWILKITVATVDYYLSDSAFTIASWNGGITTLPWISSWGRLRESISGSLGEIRVADFDCTLLVDLDASPHAIDLAEDDSIEASAATLYLWCAGLDAATDPPVAMFTGYVSDVDIPDEQTVALIFEDASTRMNNQLGTLITTDDYANADPDDVGRIFPIPYGSIINLPTRATVSGLLTTLTADITAAATSCDVARPDGIIANVTIFRIGSEDVKVTAIAGDTLTIARAQNGTTAAIHTAGDRLLERLAVPFEFVVSAHALTSIDKVVVKADLVDVDVTDQCTTYTGQSGFQYGAYGEMAVVTITQAQADVIRDRVLKAGSLALSEAGHVHSADLLGSKSQYASNPVYILEGNSTLSVANLFPSAGGTIVESTYDFNYNISCSSGSITIYIDGNVVAGPVTGHSGSWQASYTGTSKPVITVTGSGAPNFLTIQVNNAHRIVSLSGSVNSAAAGVTGEINSVADSILGGKVHADVTASLTAPNDVIADLLSRYAGGVSCSLVGSFPVGYSIDGALTEPAPLLDVLARVAFESRAWFRLVAGAGVVTVRPDSLTSARTIAACRLGDDHRKMHSRKKVAVDDVLNKIDMHYARDYSKDLYDDAAWTKVTTAADATSQADYSISERPELFKTQWITNPTMAASVAAFYLATYKRRRWRHEFEVFLDQADLEFSDIITLGFNGGTVGEITETGYQPGSVDAIDSVMLVVESTPIVLIELVLVEQNNPKNTALYAVAWSGTQFVAVGGADGSDAYIITSPDGVTWTEQNNPKNITMTGVAWSGTQFVAVGGADGTDAYIITSPDGVTWTEQINPKNTALYAVAWSGTQFVAVGFSDGADAYIVTSPDGITWTERSNPGIILYGIAWSGTQFVAVGFADGTDACIITSSDGITWTERSNPKSITLRAVTWGSSQFVAVGSADGTDAYIITSPDGVTWTEQNNPKNITLTGVAWNGTYFVAVGSTDGTDAYIITSPDGVTWTEQNNPKNINLSGVAWSGTHFVAVGGADGTDAYIITT